MAGLGWGNPFPLEMGGGETLVESHYRALTAALGKGGSAEDVDNTVDGLWRTCLALGLACLSSAGERAALQVFPTKATDLLPYYESLLFLPPSGSESDRREAAARRYRLAPDADLPALESTLQAIDPRFSIITPDPDTEETTVPGRVFEDYDATEPFNGGRKSTLFGNYSTGFVVRVLFDLGGAVPTAADRSIIAEALRTLNDLLPSWNAFSFVTARGFTLDVDRLDLTALYP